jgi:hypothetical protein
MIAAAVEGDVDGISKQSHRASVLPIGAGANASLSARAQSSSADTLTVGVFGKTAAR